MAAATWPAGLPAVSELSGYSEGLGKQSIRTDMDAGPAKVRRRGANARPYTLAITLTSAQLDTLIDFWTNDLQGGSLPFVIRHPRKANETVLCRFVDEVNWGALAAHDGSEDETAKMYRPQLPLEILP